MPWGTPRPLDVPDGTSSTVDFDQWLVGPIFEPLEDAESFQRLFLDGGTVSWANASDIAPESLYARAKSSEAACLGDAAIRLRQPLIASVRRRKRLANTRPTHETHHAPS